MLLFPSCTLLTLSLDLVGGMGTTAQVRQTLHKFDNTLRFCISSYFINSMCIVLKYDITMRNAKHYFDMQEDFDVFLANLIYYFKLDFVDFGYGMHRITQGYKG
jgi:hypothetical protein